MDYFVPVVIAGYGIGGAIWNMHGLGKEPKLDRPGKMARAGAAWGAGLGVVGAGMYTLKMDRGMLEYTAAVLLMMVLGYVAGFVCGLVWKKLVDIK